MPSSALENGFVSKLLDEGSSDWLYPARPLSKNSYILPIPPEVPVGLLSSGLPSSALENELDGGEVEVGREYEA